MPGFSANVDRLERIGNEKMQDAIDNVDSAIRLTDKARTHTEEESPFYGWGADIFHDVGSYFFNHVGDLHDSMDKNKSTLKLGRDAILEIAERYRAVDGRD